MRVRTILVLWAVAGVISALTTWLLLTREKSAETNLPEVKYPASVQVEQSAHSSQPVLSPESRQEPGTSLARPVSKAETSVQNQPAIGWEPAGPEVPRLDPLFDDPIFKEHLGRYALSYVGADLAADEVWATLIYDTELSDKVREDLMEDLNENGFSDGDGRRATVDDLPLIESRLALLEEHMDGADDFMMAHLGEAYKDLMNMWVRLSRQ